MASKNMIEILNSLSDGEWKMQQLKYCLVKSEDKVRPTKHTVISFGTEEVNTNQVFGNSGKVGIILWLDREALKMELGA